MTHWKRLEERKLDGNDMVCAVLELRAKVEALEHDAQVREAGDTAAYDQLAARIEALEWDEQAEIVNYYSALSAQHQGRAMFHGNSSSLVKRVHSCIVGEPECGHMQARATIREVAAAARAQDQAAPEMVLTWAGVAEWLEQEAGPTFSQEGYDRD